MLPCPRRRTLQHAAAHTAPLRQDFVGGHVRGAINWESSRFYDDADVDALINSLAGKERVVVHCMLSQQRGPRAAARLAARLAERGMQQPSVLVMSGGFQRFARMYGGDARLVAMDDEAAQAEQQPAVVGAST